MASKKKSIFQNKAAFSRLQSHLKVAEPLRDVQWEHRLGVLVNELSPRNVREYGGGAIEQLAKELEAPMLTANRLWLARKLSNAINARELDALLNQAKASHFDLSVSHVLALASIKKDADRVDIGKMCIERKLGVKQLRREIHKIQGKKSGGGLSLAEPESVDVALTDMLERSRDWLNRFHKIWFAGQTGCLARPLPKTNSTRLQEELQAAEEVIKEIQTATEHALKILHAQRMRGSTTSTIQND
jgi:hypothetical protein